MEVEAPPYGGQELAVPRNSRFGFPWKCSSYCPGIVRSLLPATFVTIQDCTHLVLVVGGVIGFIMIIHVAMALQWSSFASIFKCTCSLFFIMPIMRYLIQTINQYDDRLQAKQRDAQLKKENLTRSYNELLSDMDGLLTKSAESSAGLAERSFESKRRDFQRFLERAKSRYGSNNYVGSKADSDHLLKQFRRFCVNWLAVFEECSIDPISCPKRVVTSEELTRCTSIVEVCDLCLERLRVTEVRFISVQRDQDAQILRNNRNEFRRLTDGTAIRGSGQLALANGASSSAPARQVQLGATEASGASRCGWLSFGGANGCRYQSDQTDGYPAELRFFFGKLILLSRDHALLLFCLVWGVLVMVLEYAMPKPETPVVPYIMTIEVSIIVMLVRFEELDVIQQLEREVKQLAQSTAHVEQQREKMREFWSNAQQLTELWLYRTVPRLDLYKELHSQLEDFPSEDLLSSISGANQALEELDQRLGALECWRNNGALTVESKKAFGKEVNKLCQVQEFDEILMNLQELSTNGMKALNGLPAAAPKALKP